MGTRFRLTALDFFARWVVPAPTLRPEDSAKGPPGATIPNGEMLLAPDPGGDDGPRAGPVAEAVATEVLRIQARHHGHRPAGARTLWRENVLVCVLEGVFTADEVRRVASGDFEQVRAERLARRRVIEPASRSVVETATGRPVHAYMSEVGPEGVAFEAFVLG